MLLTGTLATALVLRDQTPLWAISAAALTLLFLAGGRGGVEVDAEPELELLEVLKSLGSKELLLGLVEEWLATE